MAVITDRWLKFRSERYLASYVASYIGICLSKSYGKVHCSRALLLATRMR